MRRQLPDRAAKRAGPYHRPPIAEDDENSYVSRARISNDNEHCQGHKTLDD